MFYGTKKDATEDGYTDIGVVNRTTGQIHPFGGIRGDAKQLWRGRCVSPSDMFYDANCVCLTM